MISAAAGACRNLEGWIRSNGWRGPDVCDAKSTKLYQYAYLKAQHNRLGRYALYLPLALLEQRAHGAVRAVLRVPQREYPQAIAQIARGYLSRFRVTADAAYADEATRCLRWLIANPSPGFSGPLWGQPYDWPSEQLIPAHTPRSTVTSIVIEALIDGYETLSDGQCLETAQAAAHAYLKHFKPSIQSPRGICFPYTTIDSFTVHNASAVIAAALLATAKHTGEESLRGPAMEALGFTVSHQLESGAWRYWAPPHAPGRIDNYHTGFILESLTQAKRCLGADFPWTKPLERGRQFFCENLVTESGVPKMLPDRTHPIDVQSCAESIVTLLHCVQDGMAITPLESAICWGVENLQNRDGSFAFRIYQGGRIDRSPYIRWGQSWMFRSLAWYLEHIAESAHD